MVQTSISRYLQKQSRRLCFLFHFTFTLFNFLARWLHTNNNFLPTENNFWPTNNNFSLKFTYERWKVVWKEVEQSKLFALKNTARAQSLKSIYSIAYTSEDFGRPRSSSAYRWRHASSLDKEFSPPAPGLVPATYRLRERCPRTRGYRSNHVREAQIQPI